MTKLGFVIKEETHILGLLRKRTISIELNGKEVYRATNSDGTPTVDIETLLLGIQEEMRNIINTITDQNGEKEETKT